MVTYFSYPTPREVPMTKCSLNGEKGAAELAQEFRALAALRGDTVLILRTHMAVRTEHNFASRESDALFWLPWLLGMHIVYIHTCRQEFIHIK